jgi:hypothetical protein
MLAKWLLTRTPSTTPRQAESGEEDVPSSSHDELRSQRERTSDEKDDSEEDITAGNRWVCPRYYYFVGKSDRKFLYRMTKTQRFFLTMSDPTCSHIAAIINNVLMLTILLSVIQFIGSTMPTFQ